MRSIDVRNLGGRALDYAVAVALQLQAPEKIDCPECAGNGEMTYYGYGTIYEHQRCRTCKGQCFVPMPPGHKWQPHYSTDWNAGGPLLERFHVDTIFCEVAGAAPFWLSRKHNDNLLQCQVRGETMLVAGLRCLVLSELGARIDVPEEFL